MGLHHRSTRMRPTQAQLAAALDQVLPKSHREFLSYLKSSFTCGDFFFVHVGALWAFRSSKQREEDLLWICRDFLMSEDDFGKIIVHGHTPVLQPDFA